MKRSPDKYSDKGFFEGSRLPLFHPLPGKCEKSILNFINSF
jgi:hypothetical protein